MTRHVYQFPNFFGTFSANYTSEAFLLVLPSLTVSSFPLQSQFHFPFNASFVFSLHAFILLQLSPIKTSNNNE